MSVQILTTSKAPCAARKPMDKYSRLVNPRAVIPTIYDRGDYYVLNYCSMINYDQCELGDSDDSQRERTSLQAFAPAALRPAAPCTRC